MTVRTEDTSYLLITLWKLASRNKTKTAHKWTGRGGPHSTDKYRPRAALMPGCGGLLLCTLIWPSWMDVQVETTIIWNGPFDLPH